MSHLIPRQTNYTISRGEEGMPVWALQRALNSLGFPTTEDSEFGPATEANVRKMQNKIGVFVDGVVGPATQSALAKHLCRRQEDRTSDLPEQMLLSMVIYESGGMLGAVNWTVPGGVDCGIAQRRVYDEQYNDTAAIKRAFDADYQLRLFADRVLELAGIFLPRPGVKGNKELAYRLAALNHNYPYGADKISRVGISGLGSYWTTRQNWVAAHGLKFPDGHPIDTPLEWAARYALGDRSHNEPGQVVKMVRSWT